MNAVVWAVRCFPPTSMLICLIMSDVVSGLVMLLACLGTTIAWRVPSTPRFEIALTAVLLVAAWSSVWGLYERWASWDLLIHLTLTAMLAVLAERSVDRWMRSAPVERTQRALTTVLLGCGLGAVWEIMELLGHFYVDSDVEVAPRDTLGDLLAGFVGAVLAALWGWRAPAHRQASP